MRTLACVLFLVATAACPGAEPEPERDPTLTAIRRDIFEPRCNFSSCHGGANPVRDLDLEGDPYGSLVGVDSAEDSAVKRVVAGDPEASLLYQVLQRDVGGTRQMPPGTPVEDADLAQVRAWIAAGAAND